MGKTPTQKIANKVATSLEKEIFLELTDKAIPVVIEMLMDSFDMNIPSPRMRSKIKLNKIRDAFEEYVKEEFIYLDVGDGRIDFYTPDMETFKFNNNSLQVLQVILEGLPGRYLVVTGDEYKKLFPTDKVKRHAELETDEISSTKDNLYIIKETSSVKDQIKKDKKITYEKWPFSLPINIFSEVEDTTDEEIIPKVMQHATDTTMDKVQQGVI